MLKMAVAIFSAMDLVEVVDYVSLRSEENGTNPTGGNAFCFGDYIPN